MAQIFLAPEFFKNELQNYSDWRFALIRELFQNSVDAGATLIEIKISRIDDRISVSFADDGCGMDRTTLDEVFFALGRTTKVGDSSTVGGFGKARMLICFAHACYRIRTQNLLVSGSGSSYEVDHSQEFQAGTTFEIEIQGKDRYGAYMERWLRESLDTFLLSAQIRTKTTVDGVPFTKNSVRRGREARRFEWGTVYVTKAGAEAHRGQMYIRVNGIPMFFRSIGGTAQVVLEIDADKSREVLVSNRDSMNSQYQREFDAFTDVLAKDSISALDVCTTIKEVAEGSKRRFVPMALRTQKPARQESDYDLSNLDGPTFAEVRLPETVGASYLRRPMDDDELLACLLDPNPVSDDVEFEGLKPMVRRKVHPLQIGMVLQIESKNAKMKRAAKGYGPTVTWSDTTIKLMAQWSIAIEAALEALCTARTWEAIEYRIGWVFSDTCLAQHEDESDGSHLYLINPVTSNGTRRFGANDTRSLVQILTEACHEVAHTAFSYHDEDFAQLMTTIVSRVFENQSQLLRTMRQA